LCRFVVAFSLCHEFFSFVPKRKSTKVKVFIRIECVVGLCTLESRQYFFTSSFANGCQVSYLEYKYTSLNPVPTAQVCYFNNVWFMF
jgi:hypothetical protein